MSTPHSVRARRTAVGQSLASTCLLALATVLFGMLTSGRFTNYLQAWFRPYLLAATLVMIALALWSLLTTSDALEDAAEQDGTDDEGRPGGHQHATPKVSALLLVPALVFAVAAPAALGTDAATRQDAAQPRRVVGAEPVDFTPLPAQGVSELTVQDYADRFTWGKPEDLVDKHVRMLGFVAKPKDDADGHWSVNRFRIYCCAADANLYSVAVSGADMPEGENVWVQVEGFLDEDASTEMPVLAATDVQVVGEPEEPYL
ncbi:TIGR03943 family putative permease subunit [uncultured Tessaracoccus sp.]|uniref:TIGR03943 family putative permease subunit n=1 Tax=uncultured Tessaracoccus sp. TaxID=905023 RepID=UPI0025FD389D|nr:TIGR03943 family protein [uncultured Tessaracoccus sp.]